MVLTIPNLTWKAYICTSILTIFDFVLKLTEQMRGSFNVKN